MEKTFLSACLLLAFLSISPGFSQVTHADYERVDTLFMRSDLVYSSAVDAQWIDDTPAFWYMNKERQGEVYYMVDAVEGRKARAFDHEKLADALSKAAKDKIDARKLPLTYLSFTSPNEMSFSACGSNWKYLIRQNKLIREKEENSSSSSYSWRRDRWLGNRDTSAVVSPDDLWEAYIKDYNIYIRTKGQSEGKPLTFDGAAHHYYSGRFSWSPDSRKLVTLKVRDVEERRIPLLESTPENQKQPLVQWRDYPKPGDVLPVSLPVLFDVETKKQIPLDTEAYTNPYWLNLTGWRKNSRAFTFEYNQRGHQRYIVAEVNATDGRIHHIVDEKSETFIHYYKNYRYDLKSGDDMIWISERDGWRHLYLLDCKKGSVIYQITKGEWVVRNVTHVDEDNGQIYFTASGLYADEDPYHIHHCRVNLDGSDFLDLTPENGNHQVNFSKDRAYFVDVYSRPDLPPVSLLKRSADGRTLLTLEQCDIDDLIAEGWQMPEVFHAKGRDGSTDIWGNIYRPARFDPSRSYPVVEMIYAGPHDSHVDKDFKPVHHLISRLADLGFIVVTIDGMGTANRSKAFHDVCWKNLKDAGFPDRILWIRAAAQKYLYMDISKVGIYGWSAGGQNAMGALLFHNDFYKVAVAFCGCHDNRLDKIWWNEQWMGYPLDESYAASSNVDNAHLLKGKLFLINGELDDNVDPASTLQVVAALTKAYKNFDQLYLPGKGHNLGGTYEMRRMHDYFVKHLLGQDPPEWE